ncbi:MAG: type II toxin-antitoxin system VapC family toxin [Gloeomargaritaceae cyanobacterium C42_A2020_066]|nr:type II toxin-antitoxin system VapC family toxin [Gloeomargaritaceae cyanobacterium C42_A2020_066]
MKLLLDTHTVLWFWWDDPNLSPTAKAAILNLENQVLVSRAVPWEVAIKVSLKKLDIGGSYPGFFAQHMLRSGLRYLETHDDHLAALTTLPFHHRDPFDRLMIAQAFVNTLHVVSADEAFDAYGMSRIWS